MCKNFSTLKSKFIKKKLKKKINYIIVVKKLFFISVHQNDPKHLKNINFKLKKNKTLPNSLEHNSKQKVSCFVISLSMVILQGYISIYWQVA